MGMPPAWRTLTFSLLLSTQMTWWPTSAKQVPVTRPTYPVPMIVSFMSQQRAHEPPRASAGGAKPLTSPAAPPGGSIPPMSSPRYSRKGFMQAIGRGEQSGVNHPRDYFGGDSLIGMG